MSDHDHEMAKHLADQLVQDMVSNWTAEGGPMTPQRYKNEFLEGEGSDKRDPHGLLIESNDYDEGYYMIKHDRIINKIPLLINRRDTMPELQIWLPLLKDVLLERFLEYRSVFGHFNDVKYPVRRFKCLTLPDQISTVARALLWQTPPENSIRCPRLIAPRFFSWGYPLRVIHVGVVKILPGGNNLQIVSFPIEINRINIMRIFDEATKEIQQVRNGRHLNKKLFRVWYHEHCCNNCKYNVDPKTRKIPWFYRPIDVSDVYGCGPFDLDRWYRCHTLNELRKLVALWGVRGALFIPSHQVHRLIEICGRPGVVGKPFVSPGYPKLRNEPPLFDVIRRGFSVCDSSRVHNSYYKPKESPPFEGPRSDLDPTVSHSHSEQHEVNPIISQSKIDEAI
ncbi:hypothetical protein F4859DRAFT_429996 [Xylaria cf. heliscus]|nr:hypothetical protein F4859DRAFT_429996 [Xylaria cf. heliscus]